MWRCESLANVSGPFKRDPSRSPLLPRQDLHPEPGQLPLHLARDLVRVLASVRISRMRAAEERDLEPSGESTLARRPHAVVALDAGRDDGRDAFGPELGREIRVGGEGVACARRRPVSSRSNE